MHKKRKIGVGIFITFISLILVITLTPKKEHTEEDQAMIEHCKMMPEMTGCEKYLDMATNEAEQYYYTRSTTGLEKAQKSEMISLKQGATLPLSAEIITTTIQGKEIRAYGYNGQIPGPQFQVQQNEKITIDFTNNLDVETTIHWHGLRLDNQFDGVPDITQKPIEPGETFKYELKFPDPGMYWYHPHIREDYQQELGLYGNILVQPTEQDYHNQVNKEIPIILDDILIEEDGDIYQFHKENINHALMGRFGNIMLVNGQENYKLEINKGDLIRFYITNVANTRTFNFNIKDTELKLVGTDVSNYEEETLVESVIISPSERYIIETLFEKPGTYELQHTTPDKTYTLGTISVTEEETEQDYSAKYLYETNRKNSYVKLEMNKYKQYFDKPIDAEITLTVEMPGMQHDMMQQMGEMEEEHEGIEWEDTMNMMNKQSTDKNTKWILQDKETQKENMDIEYNWQVGDKIKIRLFNDPESIHPMQHPIHFHGQRFLVLEENGKKNTNLAWKDTVLVPIGSTIDVLLDVTNPGDWMAHCHIAEHLQSGMMTKFIVIKT